MKLTSFLARGLSSAFLAGVLIAACGGRSNLLDDSLSGTPGFDGGPGTDGSMTESGIPPGCGDGRCAANESCTSCPLDCGLCPTCGNGKCDNGETCSSCAEDCGPCAKCGDGFCNGGETCLSCPQDCGACPGCGDGTCTAPNETCFTCPKDCGACPGCGDGFCMSPETCASCPMDCGVCSVCGNMKCEMPYETCVNCPKDCGDCTTISCAQMFGCVLQCIDLGSRPPSFNVACLGTCISRGCASAQFFLQQAINCFIANFRMCGPDIGCLMNVCGSEIAACLGSPKCPPGQ